MDKLDKISAITFSVFILYFLTFFTPIYSQTIFGTTIKVSISELGAGTIFVLFFVVLIVGTIVSKYMFKVYYKYVYLSAIGLMGLFVVILVLFKTDSTLRLSWYVQILFIGILIIAHFKEKWTIDVFDRLAALIKQAIGKLLSFVKGLKKEKPLEHTEQNKQPQVEGDGQ